MGDGAAAWQVRLWGDVAVEPAGGTLSLRTRALLAYLALAPAEGASRGRLAALLWEGRDDSQALANLRQLLLDHRWLTTGATPLLHVSRDRLALAHFSTDHALLCAPDAGAAALVALLAATHQPFMAGLDGIGEGLDGWLAVERARALEALRDRVRGAARTALAAGDGAAAARLADAWMPFDACDEMVVRLGFAGDAAQHDTAALERRMGQLRARLAQDFDADPAEATVAAYLAAASAMGGAAAPAPAAELAAPAAMRKPAVAPAPRRRRIALAGAVLLLLLAAALWWRHARPPPIAAEDRARAVQLVTAARQLNAARTQPAAAEAADLARAAMAHDPGSAAALAELALATWSPAWLIEQQAPHSRQRLQREALSYADRALALDPQLPRALAIKGLILGDDAGAALLERAVASDPADAEIWRWTASARLRQRDFAGALAARGAAMAVDPTSHSLTGSYVELAVQLGRLDLARTAIAQFAKAANPQVAGQFDASVALLTGRLGDAATQTAAMLRDGTLSPERAGIPLMNMAHAVGDDASLAALAARLPMLGTGYAPLIDPGGAPARARSAGPRLFDTMLSEVELRNLLRAGDGALIVAAAQPHGTTPGWTVDDEVDPIMIGAPLALALAQQGQGAAAATLRQQLAAYAGAAQRGGLDSVTLHIGRMRLACLAGDGAGAAAALGDAIDRGWRGQYIATDPDPADDPVCTPIATDPRFAAQRARLAALIASERPAVQRALAEIIAWLDAHPLPPPRIAPR